jgi:hypothetical protein
MVRQPVARGRPAAPTAEQERVVSEELREPVAQATAPVGRRRAAPTVGWMLQRLAVPGEFWEPAASAD